MTAREETPLLRISRSPELGTITLSTPPLRCREQQQPATLGSYLLFWRRGIHYRQRLSRWLGGGITLALVISVAIVRVAVTHDLPSQDASEAAAVLEQNSPTTPTDHTTDIGAEYPARKTELQQSTSLRATTVRDGRRGGVADVGGGDTHQHNALVTNYTGSISSMDVPSGIAPGGAAATEAGSGVNSGRASGLEYVELWDERKEVTESEETGCCGGGRPQNAASSFPRESADGDVRERVTGGTGGDGGHTSTSTSSAAKPNIFFFLIDDMGWNDIGYQSTDLSAFTPNMDRLAADGVKLSSYYSMYTCTPARSSLMTGRYPVRYGLQFGVIDTGHPFGLSLDEKIFPEYMNDAGYESHMVGKWHLGMYKPDMMPHRRGFETYLGYLGGTETYWTHQATDLLNDDGDFYDLGYGNQTSYYDITGNRTFANDSSSLVEDYDDSMPLLLVDQNEEATVSKVEDDHDPHVLASLQQQGQQEQHHQLVTSPNRASRVDTMDTINFSEKLPVHTTTYTTQVNAPKAIKDFADVPVEEREKQTKLTADSDEGSEIEGIENWAKMVDSDGYPTDDEGSANYNAVYSEDVFLGRATRIVESKTPWDEDPLFLYVAHQSVHSPVAQPPEGAFSEDEQALIDSLIPAKGKDRLRKNFATTLLYLDKAMGRFLATLEEQGWMENSIIIVASDNGGCPAHGATNYPYRGEKYSNFEGGSKVPGFVYSRSHIPQEAWGTTYSNVMHVTDWLPTIMSAVGGSVAGSAGPLDGVDHWAALTRASESSEQQPAPREELLYNWDSYIMSSRYLVTRNDSVAQGAFRQGKWKLIRHSWCTGYHSFDTRLQDPLVNNHAICAGYSMPCSTCGSRCEVSPLPHHLDWLFNLEDDPRETTNVIAEHPEVYARLLARAEEVVFSEFAESAVKPLDPTVYGVFAANDWWVSAWRDV